MKRVCLVMLVVFCLPLAACLDNDHPPEGGGGLTSAVKTPMDKAAAVNQTIDAQDAAQRKAMDEQGR